MNRRSKAHLRLLALFAATSLAAVVAPAQAAGLQLPSLPNLPKLPFAPAAPAAPAPVHAAPDSAGDLPLTSRPFESVQALMQKGTVNGQELVTELVSLRKLMAQRRSAAVMGAVLGTADSSGGGFDAKAELFKVGLKAVEEQVKPYVASVGFGALDLHLKQITDDPSLLAAETITLPSPKGLSHAQAQRVINMAALLVATRVTGKVLKKAQQDFANVELDYTRLIERREAAAKVLYDVLLKGAAGGSANGEVEGLYADDDLRYLRDSVSRMSVSDFSNDLGAQNLALRHLRKTDPTAWAEYKGRSDGLTSSTKGYIRTTAGVAAFAALLSNFTQETVAVMRSKKGADILLTMPFAYEFVKEVPPLLAASWAVGAAGVVELPMKASRRFRLVDGGTTEEFRNASDLFAAVKKRNAEPLLTESLFRTGADGLLYKLYRCDKSEVGRMLDTAVAVTEREKFATDFALPETARFSFANSFNAPQPSAKEQELGDELLRKDHRERSESRALGEAQRAATRGYAKWNNDQVLRLILANREGAAALATLQLGDVMIRPVPNMQSVYAYESLVDECAKQFGGGAPAAPAAAAKPGAPAPAAKPPAKKK
jgi:hypothetical protein